MSSWICLGYRMLALRMWPCMGLCMSLLCCKQPGQDPKQPPALTPDQAPITGSPFCGRASGLLPRLFGPRAGCPVQRLVGAHECCDRNKHVRAPCAHHLYASGVLLCTYSTYSTCSKWRLKAPTAVQVQQRPLLPAGGWQDAGGAQNAFTELQAIAPCPDLLSTPIVNAAADLYSVVLHPAACMCLSRCRCLNEMHAPVMEEGYVCAVDAAICASNR